MKQIYLMIMGHVDHGKSTLVGRIFYNHGYDMKKLAFLTDFLEKERKNNMTIKVGHNKLQIAGKMVLFADAPGHRKFMADIDLTDIDAVLLLVDASEGIKSQTKAHIDLAQRAGIRQVIAIVNKMDLVKYSEKIFMDLREKISKLLEDFPSVSIVPASALKNENIDENSQKMLWYKGNTVVEALVALESMEHNLEEKSIQILKEAVKRFKRPIMLWAGGKDSTTTLTLARRAFGGKVPFPVYFIDTTFKFPQTYKYIRKYAKKWQIDFREFQNKKAIAKGVNKQMGTFFCCNELKTKALKMLIKESKADAVIVSIRYSEHGVRGKETFFSKRGEHTRVHPILEWSEAEIWEFLRKNKIPVNPLYKKKMPGGLVYRSIGCQPCTLPIRPDEKSERAGRNLDKEEIMEQLRALGYM